MITNYDAFKTYISYPYYAIPSLGMLVNKIRVRIQEYSTIKKKELVATLLVDIRSMSK